MNEILTQRPSGFLPRCYYGLTQGAQKYRFIADTVFTVLGLTGQVGDAFEFISPTETVNYVAGIGILLPSNQVKISIQGDYNLNNTVFDIVNMRTGDVLSSYDVGAVLTLQDASYLGNYDPQDNIDKQITVLFDLELNQENVIFASVDFNSDDVYNWVRIGGYSNGVDGHNIYGVVSATASAVFGDAHIGDTVIAGEDFTYDGISFSIGDMNTISALSPLTLTANGNIRGPQGDQGVQGNPGVNGTNGYTPYIQDNHWYINGVDTGVVAVGQNGTNGQNGQSFTMKSGLYSTDDNYGEPGNVGPNSEVLQALPTLPQATGMTGYAYVVYDPLTTPLDPFYDLYYCNDNDNDWTIIHPFSGIKGQDGTNGETPYIQDNHWYIGGVDTGVQATGDTGATGNGIASIAKTGTVGNVDTYTITYTSGGTATFTVTNGINGTNGTNGTNGVTPNITCTATQLAEGASPTATRSGSDANPIITFGIPKGDTGATGPGVPAGGTTGQVLIKDSNTDYDTTWRSTTTSVTSDSSSLITSGGVYTALNNLSPSYGTKNTTYVDTGGFLKWWRIGNTVFCHVQDITFKNVAQANGNVIFSGLPAAASGDWVTVNMVPWGGTLTCIRYVIDPGETTLKNYWSPFTPSTSQKWSAFFFYRTNS